MTNTVLCCDWGTSSFRLRWVEAPSGQLHSEVRSDDGIAATYTAWQASGTDRLAFYRQVLNRHIARLETRTGQSLAGVPLVLSGMASASIGMLELPYASLPFPTDGSQAGVRHLDATRDFPHPTLLISGVRSAQDVMRGEETQLIGLDRLLATTLPSTGETILILPGTHSKHVVIHDNAIVGFRTYLTGEQFALLTQHSILKASVQSPDSQDFSDWTAFRQGVLNGASANLLNALFSVRTNQLFGKLDQARNRDYLSGLLIGSELRDLIGSTGRLVLGSGSHVFPHYEQAMQVLGLPVILVPTAIMEQSAVAGQLAVYELNTHHLTSVDRR